jgi:prepilin-type N-terminal cleavage/methylation domain-containing protein/prepilin-type processing-associated H-X9-DG protein
MVAMSRHHGFTLIELLVVIGIIAILAAILFPVFEQARAKSEQSTCLSNVKQLQLGLIMYASDNNQMYPYGNGSAVAPKMPDWANAIYPYVNNLQIYLCLSDNPSTGSITTYTNNGVGGTPVIAGSYAADGYLAVGGNPGTNTIPLGDAQIAYPAEMLGVIDAETNRTISGGSEITKQSLTTVLGQIATSGLVSNTRHANGCNQSYMDGHARWIAFSNIPDPAVAFTTPGSSQRHYYWGKD